MIRKAREDVVPGEAHFRQAFLKGAAVCLACAGSFHQPGPRANLVDSEAGVAPGEEDGQVVPASERRRKGAEISRLRSLRS